MKDYLEKYILNPDHTYRRATLFEWCDWLDQMNNQVADSDLETPPMTPAGRRVSTIFLGINLNFSDGPPLIFESMVFPECHHIRTSSWDDALAAHQKLKTEYEGKPLPEPNLYELAQEITDEAFGPGAFVELNHFDPSKGETRIDAFRRKGDA